MTEIDKVALRHVPNPNVLVFCTRMRLCDSTKMFLNLDHARMFKKEEERIAILAERLFLIDGVDDVIISTYEVHVTKAELFSREEILEKAKSVIQGYIRELQEMERVQKLIED